MIWSWMPARLAWTGHDQHARMSRLALAGLVAGGAMAAFGLPPADIHGPLHYLGIMDPLCGSTRGVRLALLGHLGQSWRYNPLSVVLVAGAIAAVLRQALGMATGRWLSLVVTRRRAVLAIAVLLTVALEINQQAHAALLRTTGSRLSFPWMMTATGAGTLLFAVIALTVRHRVQQHRARVAGLRRWPSRPSGPRQPPV